MGTIVRSCASCVAPRRVFEAASGDAEDRGTGHVRAEQGCGVFVGPEESTSAVGAVVDYVQPVRFTVLGGYEYFVTGHADAIAGGISDNAFDLDAADLAVAAGVEVVAAVLGVDVVHCPSFLLKVLLDVSHCDPLGAFLRVGFG